MPPSRSRLWFTTLSGVRASRPEWAEIAHYLEPVRRYLARRAPGLSAADRDDLAQEVLLAMQERLVAGYDRARGRFRTFLKGAIEHKLADLWRARGRERARRAPGVDPDALPDAPDEVPPDDAAALDLEAELLRAVRAFHDRHVAAGGEDDLALVWCFSDRLVSGLPENEIAEREGWSRDRVKRLLARARAEVIAELVGALLPDGDETTVRRAADLVREGLRRPRERARLLEAERDAGVRAAAGELLDAIGAARRFFVGLQTEEGRELLRGLEEIFAERAEATT